MARQQKEVRYPSNVDRRDRDQHRRKHNGTKDSEKYATRRQSKFNQSSETLQRPKADGSDGGRNDVKTSE
jgi:hypothetical protein